MHRDAGVEAQGGGQCCMHTSHWIQRPRALAPARATDNPSTSAGPRQWQPPPFLDRSRSPDTCRHTCGVPEALHVVSVGHTAELGLVGGAVIVHGASHKEERGRLGTVGHKTNGQPWLICLSRPAAVGLGGTTLVGVERQVAVCQGTHVITCIHATIRGRMSAEREWLTAFN